MDAGRAGLAYEVKHYQRDERALLAPPELRSVHPLGKSPVITEGPLTLAESGAILEYLAEREAATNRSATSVPARAAAQQRGGEFGVPAFPN